MYDEDYRGAADHLIMYHLACWTTDPTDVASCIEAMKLIHALIPNAISWAINPDDGSTPLHRAILSRHDTTDMVVWLLETYPEMASAPTDGYLPLIYGLRFAPAFIRKKCFQRLVEANPSALSEVILRTRIAGKTFDATALHFLLTLGAPDGKGSYSERTRSRFQTFKHLVDSSLCNGYWRRICRPYPYPWCTVTNHLSAPPVVWILPRRLHVIVMIVTVHAATYIGPFKLWGMLLAVTRTLRKSPAVGMHSVAATCNGPVAARSYLMPVQL